jgi:hypothetical protein
MILESVQIISTVASFYNIEAPYKPTHVNHPCVIWARESFENYLWLFNLLVALQKEYEFRYGEDKIHKSFSTILYSGVLEQLPDFLSDKEFTLPPQCMPEEYRQQDTVQAYRDYYSFGKKHLHKWTKREEPFWLVKVRQ